MNYVDHHLIQAQISTYRHTNQHNVLEYLIIASGLVCFIELSTCLEKLLLML